MKAYLNDYFRFPAPLRINTCKWFYLIWKNDKNVYYWSYITEVFGQFNCQTQVWILLPEKVKHAFVNKKNSYAKNWIFTYNETKLLILKYVTILQLVFFWDSLNLTTVGKIKQAENAFDKTFIFARWHVVPCLIWKKMIGYFPWYVVWANVMWEKIMQPRKRVLDKLQLIWLIWLEFISFHDIKFREKSFFSTVDMTIKDL